MRLIFITFNCETVSHRLQRPSDVPMYFVQCETICSVDIDIFDSDTRQGTTEAGMRQGVIKRQSAWERNRHDREQHQKILSSNL